MLRLYRTRSGAVAEDDGKFHRIDGEWDGIVDRDDLAAFLRAAASKAAPLAAGYRPEDEGLLPPIGSQEVWAAGVTYQRSRVARMEEASAAGGGDFYDRVYDAQRPELFFKASPHRVVGHGGGVRIRRDSSWNVPEPELTLVVTSGRKIVGYTVGNDMSSRDIEGENPLYLPQAKVYDGCCALGPGILVEDGPLPPETEIRLAILRGGQSAFEGSTTLARMKRTPGELVDWLCRESSFPSGVLLLTGTGVVPPTGFTLAIGDDIRISVGSVGTLVNRVA